MPSLPFLLLCLLARHASTHDAISPAPRVGSAAAAATCSLLRPLPPFHTPSTPTATCTTSSSACPPASPAAHGISLAAAVRRSAHTVVSAMVRGEWPRIKVDDADMQRVLGKVVAAGHPAHAADDTGATDATANTDTNADTDANTNTDAAASSADTSTAEVIRAMLLGATRLPVMLHLPASTTWYELRIAPRQLAALHILKATSWRGDIAACATVAEAWQQLCAGRPATPATFRCRPR